MPYSRTACLGIALVLCAGLSSAIAAAPPEAPKSPKSQDAAELMGASAVLKWVATGKDAAAQAAPDVKAGKRQADFSARLKAFEKVADGLSPAEAGRRWVKLVRAWAKQQRQAGGSNAMFFSSPSSIPRKQVGFADLVAAIPGPKAWPAISKALTANPPKGKATDLDGLALRLVAHFLDENTKAMRRDLKAMLDQGRHLQPWQAQQLGRSIAQIAQLIGATDNRSDPAAVMATMRGRIEAAKVAGQSIFQFTVPDLVTLVGQAKAKSLLRDILALPVNEIDIPVGKRTRALARQVALTMADKLPQARWGLVDSLDSVALYEAMAGRFLPAKLQPNASAATEPSSEKGGAKHAASEPAGSGKSSPGKGTAATQNIGLLQGISALLGGGQPSTRPSQPRAVDDYTFRQAWAWYVLGLIAHNRADDAVAQVQLMARMASTVDDDFTWSLPYDALDALHKAGFTTQVADFLHKMLARDPSLPLWSIYTETSVRAGQTKRMIETIQKAAQQKGLAPARRAVVLKHLADALLAIDQVKPGVAKLEQVIALRQKLDKPYLDLAIQTATIGTLLKQPQWVEQGLDAARQALTKPNDNDNVWQQRQQIADLVWVLMHTGRAAKAEHLLAWKLAQLRKSVHAAEKSNKQYSEASWQAQQARESMSHLLARLAGVYDRLGRYQDVVTLLDEAPYWNAADLKDILSLDATRLEPLGTVAARALAKTGHRDQALKLVRIVLLKDGGVDEAYEILLDLRGRDAIPFLDRLFHRDRFEERPLIWKAKLQLKAGQIKAAHQTISHAIAIDPSDGEEGRGDRMRDYAVLADVLKAMGKDKKAATMNAAVKAIRISENADRLYEAGLLQRGIDMYKVALTHFADAYCIQSRLAVQLSQLGRQKEAAKHFRRAFQLMPTSFGRMESHCFGCSGVFTTGQGGSIAEQVFTRLLKKLPNDPQVPYLMGYLKAQEGHDAQAIEYYQQAVKMDPDYLSAWGKLQDAAQEVYLPADQRDRATMNILRLDPLGRHVTADTERVLNIDKLWHAVEAARKRLNPPPKEAYPLQASAQRLKERRKTQDEQAAWFQAFNLAASADRDGVPTPGRVLAQHRVFQTVGTILQR